MTIDWTKPIETTDGTPLVVRAHPDGPDSTYAVARRDGQPLAVIPPGPLDEVWVEADGRAWCYPMHAPFVRNAREEPIKQNRAPNAVTIGELRGACRADTPTTSVVVLSTVLLIVRDAQNVVNAVIPALAAGRLTSAQHAQAVACLQGALRALEEIKPGA